MVEAWVTFLLTFVLVGLAFGADKYKSIQDAKLHEGDEKEAIQPYTEYTAVQMYQELVAEQLGSAAKTKDDIDKGAKMKGYLRETMKTDNIKNVNLDDLKKQINGEDLVSRIKYRK